MKKRLTELFKKKIDVTIEIGGGDNSSTRVPVASEDVGEFGSSRQGAEESPQAGLDKAAFQAVGNPSLVRAANWAKHNANFLSFLKPLIRQYGPELKKAGIHVDEEDFMGLWALIIFSSALGSFVASAALLYWLFRGLVFSLVMGASIGLIGFAAGVGLPAFYISSKKSSRKAELEAVLPFIVERFASYVEAGAPLRELIASFNNRRIYGVWVDEVNNIIKEIQLLGLSPSDALMNAAKRSPSEKLSSFISSFVLGAKSSLDLRSFINAERAEIMKDKQATVERFLENLGALTESVISLFVILPITILTMGMVASTIGGGFFGLNPTALIVVTSFVLMPLMFMVAMESVKSITPKI